MSSVPWNNPELDGWDIIGMNHYHQNGVRRLFVGMVNQDGLAIKAEGHDEEVWAFLIHEARAIKLEGIG